MLCDLHKVVDRNHVVGAYGNELISVLIPFNEIQQIVIESTFPIHIIPFSGRVASHVYENVKIFDFN